MSDMNKRVAAIVKGTGLQESSETSDIWFEDSGTDKKIGGRAGGGRVKDIEILFRSEKDGKGLRKS